LLLGSRRQAGVFLLLTVAPTSRADALRTFSGSRRASSFGAQVLLLSLKTSEILCFNQDKHMRFI
jgi:hypothetical protein